jgi:hypothetical protein
MMKPIQKKSSRAKGKCQETPPRKQKLEKKLRKREEQTRGAEKRCRKRKVRCKVVGPMMKKCMMNA